jgi:hypothetical protein
MLEVFFMMRWIFGFLRKLPTLSIGTAGNLTIGVFELTDRGP